MALSHQQAMGQLSSKELKMLFQIVMIQYDQEFTIDKVNRPAEGDTTGKVTVEVTLRNKLKKTVTLPR